MAILDLIELFDELVQTAKAVPLTDEVRIDPTEVAELVAAIRREAPAGARDRVERLERLVADAKPVPLTRDVRVNRVDVSGALDAICAALPRSAPTAASTSATAAVERLGKLFRSAPGVPFLGTSVRIRVSRRKVYELIDEIRAELPGEVMPDLPTRLDRLESTFREARAVPLTGQVIVKRGEMLTRVETMRTELGRPVRPADDR